MQLFKEDMMYYLQCGGGDSHMISHLRRQAKGNSQVVTAPFAGDTPMELVLSDWDAELKSIAKKYPTLYAYEENMRSKVGPMSIMMPLRDRKESVKEYFTAVTLPAAEISSETVQLLMNEWRCPNRIEKWSQRTTWNAMRKSTNSGVPFYRTRRDVVNRTIPCTSQIQGDELQLTLKGDTYKGAAILGWRGQEGGEQVKQRDLWMFPLSCNIDELSVYKPFISLAQRMRLVPAWISFEAVDDYITKLFATKRSSDLVIATDFTKFDQHINPALQRAARTVLEWILKPIPGSVSWLNDVFPVKYSLPIIVDVGVLCFGKHGMASGSGGTNADETIIHRLLQHEAAHAAGSKLNVYSQCLGDDGIVSYPGISVEQITEAYQSHGLQMQLDKQYASTEDTIYLRRWHSQSYTENGVMVGVYPTMRALGRLRYMERYMDPKKWNAEMVAMRQLSIIENVKYHPLRSQFADFCVKRDKFRLGLDLPGFFQRIGNSWKEFIDVTNRYNYMETEEPDPQGWWIVQYLQNNY